MFILLTSWLIFAIINHQSKAITDKSFIRQVLSIIFIAIVTSIIKF